MISAERVEAAMAQIEAAAFDPGKWDDVLRAVASATGGRFGQMLAIGESDALTFSRLPDMDPALRQLWCDIGGDHPAVNSRIRIGGAAPILQVLDESAFTTELDSQLNPAYGDLIEKADIPFICLSTLIREPGLHIGLAVMSGEAEGNFEAENRRVFEHLAAHVRRSVRVTLMLGDQAVAGAVRGLEAISAAALVCDVTGRILSLTHTAETLLASDGRLALKGDHLVNRINGQDYSDRAWAVARGDLSAMTPIVVRGLSPSGVDDPLVIEFTALPSDTPWLPRAPGVLMLIRRPWSAACDRLGRRAGALYQLTQRETEVALGLCRGLSPQAVSLSLGMALGTVRIHVRHLFDKTGVISLAQLVALLRAHDS